MRTKAKLASVATVLLCGLLLLLFSSCRVSQRGGTSQRPGAEKQTVDPVLVYSTLLGGASYSGISGIGQTATAIWVDGPGNLYVAGTTTSKNFPVTPGAAQTQPQSGFLSKIDPTGKTLLFSTYVQGLFPAAIAVDASGNIYLGGGSGGDLPIPAGGKPFEGTPKSLGIIEFNATGTAILNATYLGGSGIDYVTGLAVDSTGVYVAGTTTSNDFPVQNALQATIGSSGTNAYAAKFNTTLSSLFYSTYLGENSTADAGGGPHSLAVDSYGNVYVVGGAGPGFPMTSGAIQSTCPDSCVFVAELNASASSLVYTTFLGSASSAGSAVAVDASQNIYLAGQATNGFPAVNPLEPCGSNIGLGGFVAEITAARKLSFSTCFAETGDLSALALDASGNVYIGGTATSSLTLKNPIQANANGSSGPFVLAINPNSASLVFSSFVGLGQQGATNAIVDVGVDSGGNIYAGSYGAFPLFNALQSVPGGNTPCPGQPCLGGTAAVLMKIAPTDAAAAALSSAYLAFLQQVGTTSAPQTVTVIDMGSSALTVSNATVTEDFSIVQNNCTTVSAAGGTCTIQVAYTPTAVGTSNGTLTITDSSAGSPHTVILAGTAAVPALTPSPTTVSFGDQILNTPSAAQNVTLNNPGPLTVQISRIDISGDFTETNNCGATLSSICAVSVTFTPAATGSRTGTLTITDNAPDSPQTVALSGTGQAPSLGLSIASGGSPSAKVTAGSSATYSLSIGGGGVSGTASLSCSGAPTSAVCNVPATEQVSAATASTFTASVTTAAPGQALVRPQEFGTTPWVWAFSLLALISLPPMTKRSSALRLLCLVPLLLLILCSCGGGSSNTAPQNPGTPAGTYTLTVTAASGNTTQSQILTLVVQ
ncbi:MAG: choice-of-anchor D domain-containing protein [Candidatus Acidiferrum sp.]